MRRTGEIVLIRNKFKTLPRHVRSHLEWPGADRVPFVERRIFERVLAAQDVFREHPRIVREVCRERRKGLVK